MPTLLRPATASDYPVVGRLLASIYRSARTAFESALACCEPFECLVASASAHQGALFIGSDLILVSFEQDPQDAPLLLEVDEVIRGAVRRVKGKVYCNVNGMNRSIISTVRQIGFVEDWSGYEFRYSAPFYPSPAANVDLEFRPYEESCVDEYITLLLALAPHLSDRDVALYWLREVAKRDDFIAMWNGDRVVGVCVLEPYPATSDCYLIHSIVVEPSLHRRGLGSALMQRALDHVINGKGAKSVYLRTPFSNTAAHKLYERCGFSISGRFAEHTYPTYHR